MARKRFPFRPGSERYAQLHRAELARRAVLARATAGRTKKPEVRRRANRRATEAERGLTAIRARQDYRFKLNERDRDAFNSLSLGRQDQLLKVLLDYPVAFRQICLTHLPARTAA